MEHRIAIVGGGPRSVYALERLCAVLAKEYDNGKLYGEVHVHVYDATSSFGGGAVHGTTQASTNRLNVIAGQTTAFSDESVKIAGAAEYPPTIKFETLCDYLNRNGREIEEHEFPFRTEFGAYLGYVFREVVNSLQGAVVVKNRREKVCDIEPQGDGFRLYSIDNEKQLLTSESFSQVLLITGHCKNRQLRNSARQSLAANYISEPYPIADSCSVKTIPPGKKVAIRGKGLAFIDVVLALTLGRGGVFERNALGKLAYRFSDEFKHQGVSERQEPSSIVALSRTDILLYAKGINQRGNDQYKAKFLTFKEIDRLRAKRADGKLHFESDIYPRLILDMACEYYRVKYGESFLKKFLSNAFSADGRFYNRFTNREVVERTYRESRKDEATCFREEIVELACLEANFVSIKTLLNQDLAEKYLCCSSRESRCEFIAAHFKAQERPFDYWSLVNPLHSLPEDIGAEEYSRFCRDYVENDLREAHKGNLNSPHKAATLVPSDLVDNLRYALNYGGLLPESHRRYVDYFNPLYNRISIGPPPDNIEKLLALVDAGLLELSIGPDAKVQWSEDSQCYECSSKRVSGSTHQAEILIDARVPTFSIDNEDSLLYQNLLKRGLVRKYRNMAIEKNRVTVYTSQGIEVDRDFRLIGRKGIANERIRAMGPPVEGVRWFTNLAARYLVNSIAMQNAGLWALAVTKIFKEIEEEESRKEPVVVNQQAQEGKCYSVRQIKTVRLA